MFWIHRLDVQGKMVNIEEENVGIAGVMSSLYDEKSRHFPQLTSVKPARPLTFQSYCAKEGRRVPTCGV